MHSLYLYISNACFFNAFHSMLMISIEQMYKNIEGYKYSIEKIENIYTKKFKLLLRYRIKILFEVNRI